MNYNEAPKAPNQAVFRILGVAIAVVGLFVVLGLVFPAALSFLASLLWVTLLTGVIVFFGLGALVIIGLKREASRILDVLFEGSLSIIDVIKFIRLAIDRFIYLLKEFLVFISPILSFIIAGLIYVMVLTLYKNVGRSFDVTGLTIILTLLLVAFVGMVTAPKPIVEGDDSWKFRFKKKFEASFSDWIEVVVFAFFLTMDSTNLFFLPENLNIPVRAQIGDYDLMIRSIQLKDHFTTTVNLIILAITVEIFRNALRLVAYSLRYYKESGNENITERSSMIKEAIRKGFKELKENILKFIAFTSVLIFVFLFFPRLKLLTIVVASLTSLFLDLIMIQRLNAQYSPDLISRVLTKIFRV